MRIRVLTRLYDERDPSLRRLLRAEPWTHGHRLHDPHAPPKPARDQGLQSAEGMVLLTHERIEQLKSPRGGFTYATLRELGVEITDKGPAACVIV